MKKAFASPQAPAAVGPYSQAVGSGDLVFLSGQLGLTVEGALAGEDAASQTRQALANIRAVLAAAGLEMKDVLKTTVFLTDMNDFAAVNEVYREFFTEPFPARSCVAVAALPRGAKVEIEAVAERRGLTPPDMKTKGLLDSCRSGGDGVMLVHGSTSAYLCCLA